MIEDKNRIYNMGLFSNVEIEIMEDPEKGNIYMITVSEMWYIWPFPIIDYDNKSEKFSYGGGISHNNFRGRHENIVLGGTIGNVNEYFLWYKNPWISGDHNSLEIGIYNESGDHHVYDILERDKGFFTQGGFYIGSNKKFKFWINYNNKLIEKYNPAPDKDTLELEYLDQMDFTYIRLGSQYKYDTRDIYIDPHSGILFNIELDNTFSFNGTQNMHEIEVYLNTYKNLYESYIDPILKYKLFIKLQYSNSDLPIFKKEYIGGQGYVRGYSSIPSNNPMNNPRELIEVDNFFINTFEIQSTLVKRKEYLPKVEMGIDILFFTDWGIGCDFNRSIDFNNSLFGYGVGIKIFLMGGVIKLDYAFNFHGTSRLHLF